MMVRIDPPSPPAPQPVDAVDLNRLKAMKRAADTNGDGITTRSEFQAFARREQQINITGDVTLWRANYSQEIAFVQQNDSKLFQRGESGNNFSNFVGDQLLNDSALDKLAKNDGNARDLSRRDLNGPIIAGLPPLPVPTPVPPPVPVPPPLPTPNSVAVNDLESFRRSADTNQDGRLSEAEFNSAASEIDDRQRWNELSTRADVVTGRAFRFYGNNDAGVVNFIRANRDVMFSPSYRMVNSPQELISSGEVVRRAGLNGNTAELTQAEVRQQAMPVGLPPVPQPVPTPAPVPTPPPANIRSIETDRLSRLITQADTDGDRSMSRSEFNTLVSNMRAQDDRLALNPGGRQAPVRYYDRQAIQFIQENADQIFQAIGMTASFPGSTIYSSLSQSRLRQIASSLGDPANVTRQEVRGGRYYGFEG